jgi:hypothetical protein
MAHNVRFGLPTLRAKLPFFRDDIKGENKVLIWAAR